MHRRSVLVLGGGGFIGSVLCAGLRAVGSPVDAPRSATLDVRDAGAVEAYVDRLAPDVVMNLAAAQPGASLDDLEAVNHIGARAVATAANRCGARLVHVATDVVHDGLASPYADDAPAHPITPYGISKARGERAVLAAHPAAVSVRTSLSFDPAALDRGTAGFVARLAAGIPCALFTDEIRCPLPRAVLAECLVRLMDTPVRGPLNIAGREALSRHAFGTRMLAHFDVPDRERVVATQAAATPGLSPRSLDVRLTVTRVEALLGIELPTVRSALAP